jgi:hypothetical protein
MVGRSWDILQYADDESLFDEINLLADVFQR